jgi:hypothetical protein
MPGVSAKGFTMRGEDLFIISVDEPAQQANALLYRPYSSDDESDISYIMILLEQNVLPQRGRWQV